MGLQLVSCYSTIAKLQFHLGENLVDIADHFTESS
jgi:hypothetical protein